MMHTVGSAADARRAVDAGVDVIVAQGWEAGGHVRGTVATMPLVPTVVDAVSPAPVVAAGGIADGRGLAAALALGAVGVWIGTRLLASNEAAIHPRYRERILQANEVDTIYLDNLFDVRRPNAPHRTLRNQTVQNWETTGRPASGKRPGEGEVIGTSKSVGPIVRYQSYTPGADAEGNIDAMSLWAGQSVGLVSETQSAADIVREIAEQADRFFGDCHDDRCGSFVSFGSCAARASLDTDIQYPRQLRKRQRCRPDDGRDQRHEGAVAAALATHLAGDPLQDFGVDTDCPGWRPAFDCRLRRKRNGARRHRQTRGGGRMVDHRLGHEIVETTLVAALGGRVVDLEQRFRLSPADRLMVDGGRGQDARAPGGVQGIQRAGKMHATLRGRAFARDHAITHDAESLSGAVTAGNRGRFERADRLG